MEAKASIAAAVEAAATRLLEALSAGAERNALPLSPKTDSFEGTAAAAGNKLLVARAALAQLEGEAAAARDLLAQRGYGVARGAALEVMVDEAAQLADEITAADDALAQKRANLDSLAMMITGRSRRLIGAASALPVKKTPPNRRATSGNFRTGMTGSLP
jgi:hypothetical protein